MKLLPDVPQLHGIGEAVLDPLLQPLELCFPNHDRSRAGDRSELPDSGPQAELGSQGKASGRPVDPRRQASRRLSRRIRGATGFTQQRGLVPCAGSIAWTSISARIAPLRSGTSTRSSSMSPIAYRKVSSRTWSSSRTTWPIGVSARDTTTRAQNSSFRCAKPRAATNGRTEFTRYRAQLPDTRTLGAV